MSADNSRSPQASGITAEDAVIRTLVSLARARHAWSERATADAAPPDLRAFGYAMAETGLRAWRSFVEVQRGFEPELIALLQARANGAARVDAGSLQLDGPLPVELRGGAVAKGVLKLRNAGLGMLDLRVTAELPGADPVVVDPTLPLLEGADVVDVEFSVTRPIGAVSEGVIVVTAADGLVLARVPLMLSLEPS